MALGLLAALLLLLFGLLLVYKGAARLFEETTSALNNKQIVDLNEVSRATDLLPYLVVFENQADRDFAARKIYDFLSGSDTGIARRRILLNVGSLANIRVTEREIDSNPQLIIFRARLAEAREKASQPQPVVLPLLRLSELRQIKPVIIVRKPNEFRRLMLTWSILFLASFLIVGFVWRFRDFQGDALILPGVMLLSGLGLILMISIPDPLRDKPLLADFSLGVIIGVFVMLAISLIDVRPLLRKFWVIPLLLGIVLSIVLITFGTGPGNSDAKVNLAIPLVGTVQPVEIIKILVVLFLAGYFSEHWQFLRGVKEKGSGLFRILRSLNAPRIEYFLPVVIGTALIIFFFLLQKDNGPALVLFALFLILYAVARRRFIFVTVIPAVMIPTIWLAYNHGFVRTVGERVEMWFSPWDNCVRGGDQLASALWALAAGDFSGTGLGLGQPSMMPAAHTDLVLPAIGEEMGFVGVLAVSVLYAILIHRCIRLSLRAIGDYPFFLSFGLAMILALSFLLIGGGSVGLVPLSGVVFPFLSYGKTSMIANFIIVGLILSISAVAKGKNQKEDFKKPINWTRGVLAALCIALLLKTAYVQVIKSDETLIAGTLAVQSDGSRLYEYNPRLLEIAREIPRGSIYDRNGIPLTTSRCDELDQHRTEYQRLGINLGQACSHIDARYYPFGGLTYHLLGDWRTRERWGASNTLFEERDSNIRLQGYDDHSSFEKLNDTCSNREIVVQKRNLQELIPLLRHRFDPENQEVKQILSRDRNVHLSIDMRLQRGIAAWLGSYLQRINKKRGAVVVLDPETGDLLASVSYPYPEVSQGRFVAGTDQSDEGSFFDRAREGLYPPGSTFKIVTTLAALRRNTNTASQTFSCIRLSDGRVGNVVQGRTIRDDVTDREPHGTVDMEQGFTQSCNAYFAQLGLFIGPETLCDTANAFEIRVTKNNDPAELRPILLESAYGQGQVVLTPFQMARVAATIANDGIMQYGRWVTDDSNRRTRNPETVTTRDVATLVAQFMRAVVTHGTGRKALSGSQIPIAGKTGTAQVQDEDSHSWFAGFAPYGTASTRRVAFAIFIENGGYGGRAAAPVAAEIASEARDFGLILR